MNMRRSIILAAVVFSIGAPSSLARAEELRIADGKKVSLEYTLRLSDGTVIDSNVGKQPLVYVQGGKQIIPGLEKQLVGLKAGDSKKVEVSPEEGYGPVNPAVLQEIPRGEIDPNAKVGETVFSQDSYGRPMSAKVKEIKEATVVLEVDLNHPLAGKRLYFDVVILNVENS